jgi:GcrA cell cycle regulator
LRIAQTSVYCDLGEILLTVYAIIAKSKSMIWSDGKSPPAAAFPPSAAEPAAGIASSPYEEAPMPAASFLEASDVNAAAVRQWAIAPKQCRWIVAEESAGADALMCGAPAEPHRPFCAIHCARAYMKLAPEEEAAAETETETIEVETTQGEEPEAEEAE